MFYLKGGGGYGYFWHLAICWCSSSLHKTIPWFSFCMMSKNVRYVLLEERKYFFKSQERLQYNHPKPSSMVLIFLNGLLWRLLSNKIKRCFLPYIFLTSRIPFAPHIQIKKFIICEALSVRKTLPVGGLFSPLLTPTLNNHQKTFLSPIRLWI